jgi:hypothetical protein
MLGQLGAWVSASSPPQTMAAAPQVAHTEIHLLIENLWMNAKQQRLAEIMLTEAAFLL